MVDEPDEFDCEYAEPINNANGATTVNGAAGDPDPVAATVFAPAGAPAEATCGAELATPEPPDGWTTTADTGRATASSTFVVTGAATLTEATGAR